MGCHHFGPVAIYYSYVKLSIGDAVFLHVHPLLLLILICKLSPSESEPGIFRQILLGKLDFQSEPWPSISDSAKDLIHKMLDQNPKTRLTAHEVLRKSYEQVA